MLNKSVMKEDSVLYAKTEISYMANHTEMNFFEWRPTGWKPEGKYTFYHKSNIEFADSTISFSYDSIKSVYVYQAKTIYFKNAAGKDTSEIGYEYDSNTKKWLPGWRTTYTALAHAGPAPTAVIYQVNSLVSGTGTLEDEALRIAGFRNLAPELNLAPGGRVALESIIAHPPDLLVLSGQSGEFRTVVADNLSHPALRAIMREHATIVVPWRHWLCGTPYIADAIEALAAARRRITAGKPPA